LTFVSSGFRDAGGTAANLRPRASALYHLQLLPAAATTEDLPCARRLCDRVGKAARPDGFQLIGYVVMPEHVHLLLSEPPQGTPSMVLQKLKLRMARKLRKRKRTVRPGQSAIAVRTAGTTAAGLLAGAFLRFQRVQQRQEEREAPVYARQSSASQTGEPSQGFAVEQLVVLRAGRRRLDTPRRCLTRRSTPRTQVQRQTWGTRLPARKIYLLARKWRSATPNMIAAKPKNHDRPNHFGSFFAAGPIMLG